MTESTSPKTTRRGLLHRLLGLGAVVGVAGTAQAGETPAAAPSTGKVERVAYHLDSLERAIPMIRNLSNHLEERPWAKIQVVAIGQGLKMLVSGTEDDNGNEYEALVNDLQRRGIVFKACQNTMDTYHLTTEDLVWDAVVVRSGMAELARLQVEEGFAYLKV